MSTTTVEQKAAKAAKERARKAYIKAAEQTLIRAEGIEGGVASLDPTQRKRAAEAPAGLTGKSLGLYILTGKNSREQIAKAREENGTATVERKLREKKDPEASALAAKAKERAPFKSKISPAQARAVLDLGKAEDVLTDEALADAVAGRLEGEEGKATRKKLAELSADVTNLYGRKLAVLLIALREKG